MVRVIGISSGKGGVGKTTVATNLGIALSNFGKRVILVDCNLSTPHMVHYLGDTKFSKTLNDVLKGKIEITSAIYHHNGVMYVPASNDLEDLVNLDVAKLKKAIKKLSDTDMIDYIILDSAPGLGREAVSVLDASDEVVFVSQPLESALTDVDRCNQVVKQMGKKKVSLVVNMVKNKKYELKQKDILESVGIPIVGNIPFDKNVERALVQRKPIVTFKPYSQVSVNYHKLAANVLGINFKPSSGAKLFRLIDSMRDILSS
ncbi:MAG: P-loop NTPase [Candidatus Aenigmarchaeota archaeon]|nr:P-loop NTPase [Candidatus Aenigmarchaeota archaeon]